MMSGTSKHFILLRHGETFSNRQECFRGREAVALNTIGRQQAREARVAPLLQVPSELILTSPLERAVETVRLACPDQPYRCDERLNNLDLGAWGGLPKAVIAAQEPERWQQWLDDPENMTFPGGESMAELRRRVGSLLGELPHLPHKRVLLVSHRSVFKVLLALALDVGPRYFWKFRLDNASLSELVWEERRGWILVRLNDTHHLSAGHIEWQ